MRDANTILRRQSQLETLRSNTDSHWQEIAEYILPNSATFTAMHTPGTKRMERVFDSTPISANERFAAAMQSMLTPATQRWHTLEPTDPGLMNNRDVRLWCDEATDVLFAMRYAPQAQFGAALGEAYLAFGAFGNAVVFVDEKRGEHLCYSSGHPHEFYVFEDSYGVVIGVHRKFKLTAEQSQEQFGDVIPPEISRAVREAPDSEFEFIHAVEPTKPESGVTSLFAFDSVYVSCTGKKLVRQGGYRTFPFAVGRYSIAPGEVYGRGPGATALPDVKMLNEMMKTVIRAAQKVVDPPIMVFDDGILAAFDQRPGAINPGTVDAQGRQLAHPFETHARVDIGFDLIDQTRRRINDTFHVSLFQVLVDKPDAMTATEALIRAQEKGALLAPVGQRAQGEFLGTMIRRELDILQIAGQLPPMPDVLRMLGGIAALRVQYTAPVNQAQKAQKGVSIMNFIQMSGVVAQADPNIIDLIDGDETTRQLAAVNGVPTAILRAPKDVEAIREQKQQNSQAQQVLAAAPVAASAAKDLSAAQANAAGQPNTLLPLTR